MARANEGRRGVIYGTIFNLFKSIIILNTVSESRELKNLNTVTKSYGFKGRYAKNVEVSL